jgi:hypothetical protein
MKADGARRLIRFAEGFDRSTSLALNDRTFAVEGEAAPNAPTRNGRF